MRRNRRTKTVALCGVLAGLALALMFLGGVLPFATIACPVLASLVLLPVYSETGYKWGFVWYLAVAALALFTAPDKEAAFLFVVFGCYPILHKLFGRLPFKALRWIVKFLYLNAGTVVVYCLMLFVFSLQTVTEDFADMKTLMLAALLLMANVSFLLYDLLLDRLEIFYHVRLRPKLKL